ncbi:MAG: hypothetical protein H7Y10_03700 [Flavobacterium sp.]|nr:hypothetical protein [Flavobacterium sp.]
MGFSIRFLTDSDYELLCQWWKDWKWDAPPRDFLPQNGLGGIMVEKDGVPVVAGFVYFTNSAVAWSEFIISDFQYREKDRKQAKQILIFELCELARSKGSKYIYTVVKNQFLKKDYEEAGFTNGSKKVDEMVMFL